MQLDLVLKELKSFANEAERALYQKNSAGSNVYGVSLSNIRILAEKIGPAHNLGLALWETQIVDAQMLSCLILDESIIPSEIIDKMAEEIDYFQLADLFAKFIWRTRFAKEKATQYILSSKPYIQRMGYVLCAILAILDADMPDDYFLNFLNQIASDFETAPVRVKEGMNNALVEISVRNERLNLKVLETLRLFAPTMLAKGKDIFSFDPLEILDQFHKPH